MDFLARLRHAGCIPDGKIINVPDHAFRHNLYLSLIIRMHLHSILSGFLCLFNQFFLGHPRVFHNIVSRSYMVLNNRYIV